MNKPDDFLRELAKKAKVYLWSSKERNQVLYQLWNKIQQNSCLLIILSETGELVVQTKAKTTKLYFNLFSSHKGERFSIKIFLENLSFTEAFLI